jgi:hypothetical protein
MGLQISRVWEKLFGKKEMRILMVGLDAAGKVIPAIYPLPQAIYPLPIKCHNLLHLFWLLLCFTRQQFCTS